MRTAKHTPGPWALHGAYATQYVYARGDNISGVVTTINLGWPGAAQQEEQRANARLIRAAPEMRALLCSICDSANEAEEYAAIQAAEVLLALVDGTEVAA